MRALLTLVLILAGCPKSSKSPQSQVDWGSTPRLPSPNSATYQRAPTRPDDPVLAKVTEGLPWDEALSGAAARIALTAVEGEGGLARWEIREAAWLAGYPYPVRRAKGWSTLVSAPPPDDLFAFLGAIDREEDLGLVRARSPRGDAWVALVARPRVKLAPKQRSQPLGATLSLEEIPGGRYAIADADGTVSSGELPAQIRLGLAGEWLVELSDPEGLVAKFPLYVGMSPPSEPLFRRSGETISDADAARQRALQLLGDTRAAYGVDPWQEDLILGAAARQALFAEEGLADPSLTTWTCEGATVEDCVDDWVWSVDKRGTLLSEAQTHAGVAADWDAQGLRLVVVLPTG